MISIVIPLYNKAHTIVQTLESVLAQSFKDFEIIIINDGSTDNSVEAIKQLCSDIRIKIINQTNQGVSVARNNGVLISRYEHIAFLDGDDRWDATYLTKMIEAINRYPEAGLYCSAGIVINGDGSKSNRTAKKYKGKITEIDFFENPHVFVHTSAAIVKKTIFNKTQGFPIGIWNEDLCLFYSIALISKVVYSGYPLSVYVGGVEGQSTSIMYENDGSFRKDSVPRYNIVHENWLKAGSINKSYIIFLKYEIRHSIKMHLINKNYSSIKHYIEMLLPAIISNFSKVELLIFKTQKLNIVALLYINLTKLKWYLNNYPKVGEK